MALAFAIPFQVGPSGTINTHTQGSAQAVADLLTGIISTIQGECDLQAGYGIPDPTYTGISASAVTAQAALWSVPCTIDNVTVDNDADGHAVYTVKYT